MQEIYKYSNLRTFFHLHTPARWGREGVRSEIMTKNWYAHTLQCWRLKSIRKIGISENWNKKMPSAVRFFVCLLPSISHKQLFCCCFLASLSRSHALRQTAKAHTQLFIAHFEIQTLHFFLLLLWVDVCTLWLTHVRVCESQACTMLAFQLSTLSIIDA